MLLFLCYHYIFYLFLNCFLLGMTPPMIINGQCFGHRLEPNQVLPTTFSCRAKQRGNGKNDSSACINQSDQLVPMRDSCQFDSTMTIINYNFVSVVHFCYCHQFVSNDSSALYCFMLCQTYFVVEFTMPFIANALVSFICIGNMFPLYFVINGYVLL